MSPSSSAGQPPVAARTAYVERLDLPWWLWLTGLVAAALLAVEIWMGAGGVRAWLPFAVLLPATAAGLWWLGRIRVAVADGELRVDDARLPVRFVADVVPLDVAGRREVLGVGADPLAFVVQRPWIGGAVQVVLDDPADPTPFWVVSTRHPVELAEALLTARDARARVDRTAGEPG
ncbi:DUF3093 domain-containing protein [Micromonospora cremea]|uniref:DUF3093 domain-containing protein n=1 Tax=Micromonospora cremea TaxID=709881 RepID=A0A1N6AZX9_9ACTN|nr:DUF3093 domain-containing protein [Micromonospora cremea]SIN39542.1 Protein of unknown function [Micromonospora cremea]